MLVRCGRAPWLGDLQQRHPGSPAAASDGEALAAAAGGAGVGVVELEAFVQALAHPVELGAVDHREALRIHQQLHALALEGHVGATDDVGELERDAPLRSYQRPDERLIITAITVGPPGTFYLADKQLQVLELSSSRYRLHQFEGLVAQMPAAPLGAWYSRAQDRLWLFDLLRNVGRGRASQFLGPAGTTYDLDNEFGVPAGYSEQELTDMANNTVAKLGALGPVFLNDTQMFVAGMNAYVSHLLGPGVLEIPLEYTTLAAGNIPKFPPPPLP